MNMTIYELYDQLKAKFLAVPEVSSFLRDTVTVCADSEPEQTLVPQEERLSRVRKPEYRVTAVFRDVKGEAYTETPASFSGTLEEALSLQPGERGLDARMVASVNAVMHYLGFAPGIWPEDAQSRMQHADRLCSHITEHYGKDHIVLIGYDGYLVKRFMEEGLDFWTLDRDPEHITKDRFHHVIVNSGRYNREAAFAWGRILIVTGSTLCNGTIVQYLNSGKELLFYGVTIGGAAALLDLPWFPV